MTGKRKAPAKQAEKPEESQLAEAVEVQPTVEAEKPEESHAEKPSVWVIAEGYSRTSSIGVLVSGNEVKPSHFKGGQEVFDRLIESKVIVRK